MAIWGFKNFINHWKVNVSRLYFQKHYLYENQYLIEKKSSCFLVKGFSLQIYSEYGQK